MKTSKPKPEEILNKHHIYLATGNFAPKEFKDFINKAMREYAEVYHKAKLREELINYIRWLGPENIPITEWPTDESIFIDKYLNRQK